MKLTETLFIVAVSSATFVGCAGETTLPDQEVEPVSSNDPNGEAPPCTTTKGTAVGKVYLFGPPGDPLSELAPEQDEILFERTDGTDSVRTRVDAEGGYEVLLEAGVWSISSDFCVPLGGTTVTIEACKTTEKEVVFDICPGE